MVRLFDLSRLDISSGCCLVASPLKFPPPSLVSDSLDEPVRGVSVSQLFGDLHRPPEVEEFGERNRRWVSILEVDDDVVVQLDRGPEELSPPLHPRKVHVEDPAHVRPIDLDLRRSVQEHAQFRDGCLSLLWLLYRVQEFLDVRGQLLRPPDHGA